VDFTVHLGNNSSAVVTLLDSSGNTVKTFNASGKDSSGSVSLSWDGTNDKGETLSEGSYTIQVENEDTDSSLYAYVKGTVDSVLFTSTGAVAKVNGEEISVGNILEVS
jgi:flagellar basal-body rod modification protein FlgD